MKNYILSNVDIPELVKSPVLPVNFYHYHLIYTVRVHYLVLIDRISSPHRPLTHGD